ncbi:hypothetical protein DVH05_007781 [Phytophthora capsici]|nr:hypothetical protein DVH05_007781 [Phytophthora capsici]
MRGQDNVPVEHHGKNPPPGRLGALALSMLDVLLHRHTPPSPNSRSKVSPWSRKSRTSRASSSRREERSRYEARSRREGHSTREKNTSLFSPSDSFRRSSSVKLLQSAWGKQKPSTSSRNSQSKVAVSNTDKEEAPEVVTNYVYDVPEKKSKTRSDYDDNDELESDDFDDLDDEDDIDDLDFEMRPFISEDEDEMAYFAHRMGGSDFKMLRRHVLHPHGRIRSIWDTFTLFLTTWVLIIVPFELCFDMNNALRSNLLHLDLFIDSMFFADILLKYAIVFFNFHKTML